MKTHFVYAGHNYYEYTSKPLREYFSGRETRLKAIILNGMKKYQLDSVMVTNINMHRMNLITKERMENYYKGKEDEKRKHSVNDDLESLFGDIRLGKEPDECIHTYFLPKLTNKELKLVESKDYSYFQTFQLWYDPDVDATEMMQSESDSKFVQSGCGRRTFTIENSPSNCCNCSF